MYNVWLFLQATEQEVILMEQQLYSAVTSTSSWVDDVENTLFSGPALLTENAETQLSTYEVWAEYLNVNV